MKKPSFLMNKIALTMLTIGGLSFNYAAVAATAEYNPASSILKINAVHIPLSASKVQTYTADLKLMSVGSEIQLELFSGNPIPTPTGEVAHFDS